MVTKNPTQKIGTSRRDYDRKVRKKDTFGVQPGGKEKKNGKKAAILITAAVLASATIAVPAVIYYQKNFGYQVKIESIFDGEYAGTYTQKLKRGSRIGDIIPPNKSGWFFAGFFADEGLTQQLDPDTKIKENTTIYLHYVEIKYHLDLSQVHVNYLDALSFSKDGEPIDADSILYYDNEFLVTIQQDSGYADTLTIDGAVETTQSKIDAGQQVEPNQHYFVVNAGNTDAEDLNLLVHFERESLLFNVTFFDYDGSYNQYSNILFNTPIPTPTHKDRQDTQKYRYKFLGWAEADEYGNPINLDETGKPVVIEQQDFEDGAVLLQHKDMYFVAVFEENLQEYELVIEANPPAVAQRVEIYIDGVKVTDQNNGQIALYKVKYDQKVTITYSEREGWHKSSFTIGGVEQNANSVTFNMQDNIVVRYEEELNKYTLGEIPQGVSVTTERDGKIVELHSFDNIEHFEELTFDYDIPEGHEMLTFTVNGQPIEKSGTYQVSGDIQIVFVERVKTFVVEIPKQVKVTTKEGEPVLNNQKVEYGTELTISYQPTLGWEMTKFLVDGKPFESGKTHIVKNDVRIEYEEQLKTYKMGTIPAGVEVRRKNGELVHEQDTITHFEKLTISYTLSDGHHKTAFSVNGKTPQDEKLTSITIEVDGEVNIIFEQAINVYSVVFKDENKITELDTQSVEWGKPASTDVVPTKNSDLKFNYKFSTWVDDDGEEVDLSSIKQDMVVYASYTGEYIKYSLNIPKHVTVTFISGESVHTSDTLTEDDKLYYDDRVRVSYVSSTGYTRTVFNVNSQPIEVGQTGVEVTINGNLQIEYEEAINVYKMGEIPDGVTVTRQEGGEKVQTGDDITHFEKLIIHYNLREGHSLIDFKVNGQTVSNDYVHTVEGQFTISFVESINKYSLGEIPAGVTVTKNGVKLESNAQLEYGDQIVISYELSTGKHLTRFAVNGKEVKNNYSLTVKKEITIEFIEDYDTFAMLSVPKGVTVTRVGGQEVHQGDTITYNETLTVSYTLDEGHHRTKFVVAGKSIDKELTSTSVVVTGAFEIEFEQAINQYIVHFYGEYNDGQAQLIKDVTVNWGESASTDIPTKNGNETYEYKFDFWANERGEKVDLTSVKAETTVYAHFAESYVKYHLHITGHPIIVYKGGTSSYDIDQPLTAEDTLHYDDTIEISYQESVGHQKSTFKINDTEQTTNKVSHQVKGDIKVEYTEVAIKYDVTFYNYDGKQLRQIQVEYGDTAIYPEENPTQPSTDKFYYTFEGWASSLGGELVEDLTITQDTQFYAKYVEHHREYSLSIPSKSVVVTFVSGDSSQINAGQLSNSSKLYFGDIISIKRTPPQGKEEESFSFSGLTQLDDGNYQVTGDVTISYEEKYIEYKIIIPNMEEHLTIEYLSGSSAYGTNQKLTSANTLHYDDTIRVTYTQSAGFTGKLSVDGAITLSEDEYKVTGDLTLTYQEDYIDYNVNFPVGVTVTRDGQPLETGAVVHINDELQISYTLQTGYHVTEFTINTKNINEQTTNYTVKAENVDITFKTAINTHEITFPSQVTVMADGQKLQSGAIVNYGQELIITYQITLGFEKTMFDVSDGLTLQNRKENKYKVTALVNEQELSVYYTEDYIPYKLNIPEGVVVIYKSGSSEQYQPNQPLTSNDTLHYDDIIEISFHLDDDMTLNYFTINDQYYQDTQQHTVKENVNITFDQVHAYLEFRQIEGGWEVSSLKDSSKKEIIIPGVYKKQAVLSIGDQCFSANNNITQVTIKDGVTTIGNQAFANCSALQTVVLPSSLTEIGESAFAGTGITSIIIPSAVTTLGNNAFENCNITDIVIDSANIYNTISGESGDKLLANAISVKVKKSVVEGNNTNDYLNNKANFRKTLAEDYYLFTASSTLQYMLTFTAADNLSVTFLGGNSDYRVGSQLESGSEIHYGDQLQITYDIEVGHHVVNFKVNSGEFKSGNTLVVESDVSIEFEQAIDQHTLSISGEVSVSKNGEELDTGDIVYYGDELTITYTTSPGKQGSLTCSGLTNTEGNTYKVTSSQNNMVVEVNYQESWIDYTLTISDDTHVIVTYKSGSSTQYSENEVLKTGSKVHYGDSLVVTCQPSPGYKVKTFTIDGVDQAADTEHPISVTTHINIFYEEERNIFTVNFFNEDGSVLGSKDVEFGQTASWTDSIPTKAEDNTFTYSFSGSWSKVKGDSTPADLTITESTDFYAIMRSSYKEYTISIPEGVTVTYLRGTSQNTLEQDATHSSHTSHNMIDAQLNEHSTLHYGDVIAVSVEEYKNEPDTINIFSVKGADEDNDEYTVEGNIVITRLFQHAYLEMELMDGYYRVNGFGKNALGQDVTLPEVEIPDTFAGLPVKEIRLNAFSNSEIETISFGKNITTIKDGAFSYSKLQTIIFKSSNQLQTIEQYAFSSCEQLQTISGLEEATNLTSIGTNAFDNCTSLSEITIPENLESIGVGAFAGCENLRNVFGLENSKLISIGAEAFAECINLTEITIPESVTTISYRAFAGCNNLTTINYNAVNAFDLTEASGVFDKFDEKEWNITINFGDSVEHIPAYLFDSITLYGDDDPVNYIRIGKNVTSIGYHAFGENNRDLREVTIESPTIYSAFDNEEYFGSAIGGLVNTSIIVPKTIVDTYTNNYLESPSDFEMFDIGEYYLFRMSEETDLIYTWVSTNDDYYWQVDGIKDGRSVTDIKIPDKYMGFDVVLIKNDAFANNPNITSVSLGENIKFIGDFAFNACTGINEITLPSNLLVIGESAFAYCSGLTSVDTSHTAFKRIDKNAFRGCSALEDMTLPSSVKLLDEGIFTGCSSLTSINIPEGIEEIPYIAFSYCANLASITLPSTITSIGNSAFEFCTSLTTLDMSEATGLDFIDGYAFNGCTALTTIKFNARNCQDINDPIFLSAGTSGEGVTIIFGDDVEKIPAKLFQASGVSTGPKTTIVMGRNIKEIGKFAFAGCDGLTEITIPESVLTIGESAFELRETLQSVIFDGQSKLQTIGANAFYSCSGLTELNLPSSVTEIKEGALHAIGVRELVLPANLISLGKDAVSYCPNLEILDMSQCLNLSTIGEAAFFNCTKLKTINYNAINVTSLPSSNLFGCSGANTGIKVTFGNDVQIIPANLFATSGEIEYVNIATAIIGNNVRTIGVSAFQSCKSLISVDMSQANSLDNIDDYAFYDCEVLDNLIFPSNLTRIGHRAFYGCENLIYIEMTQANRLQTIDDYAFQNCIMLSDIWLPESVTSIGVGAFSNSGLASINLEDLVNLSSISNYAFDTCTSLQEITIPSNVTSIGEHAFTNALMLRYLNFAGSSLQSIGSSAFEYCPALNDFYIPASVTSIGEHAFLNCTGLKTVTIASADIYSAITDITSCGNIINYATTIYVPKTIVDNSSSAFLTAEHGYFKSVHNENLYRFEKIEHEYLTFSIGEGGATITGLKDKNDARTELVIPDYIGTMPVIEVGDHAFEGNKNISSITISNNVTVLGVCAFASMPSVSSIDIPAGVREIKQGCFGSCANLTTVNFVGAEEKTNMLQTIGSGAFRYCGSLHKIVIPSNVTTIGGGEDFDYEWAVFYQTSIEEATIESPTIANALTDRNDFGGLLRSATTIYTLKSNGQPEFLLNNFNMVDGAGDYADYYVWSDLTYNYLEAEQAYEVSGLPTSVANFVTDLKIPDTYKGLPITSIGSGAFAGCSNITSVQLGSNIKIIEDGAFEGCDNPMEWIIPKDSKLSSIDNIYITKITFKGTLTDWCHSNIGSNAMSVLMSELQDLYIDGNRIEGDLIIPNDVTRINDRAFYGAACSGITSVKLGQKVQKIGSYAFYHSYMTKLDMISATQLTEIGEYAFANCKYLETLNIGRKTKLNIGKAAFKSCGIVDINLPDGVIKIGDEAFSNNTKATQITIPVSVTTIGNGAFSECTALENIYYNAEKVTSLGTNMFYRCGHETSDANGASITVTFGYSVKIIPDRLFSSGGGNSSDGPHIYKIIIGSNVTSIGNYSFAYMYKLRYVSMENASKLSSIGSCAFYRSGSNIEITIPQSVVSCGFSCFADASISILKIDSATIYKNGFSGNFALAAKLYVLKSIISNNYSSTAWVEQHYRRNGESGDYYIYN